jgi:hypothetical protein
MNKHMARKAVLALVAVATLTGFGMGQHATAASRTILVRLRVTNPIAEDTAGAVGNLVSFDRKPNGDVVLVYKATAF